MQLDITTAFTIFNYGVDYGLLIAERERENEEWADAFNCFLFSQKTAMPAMPSERRHLHTEKWLSTKKKSFERFQDLLAKIAKNNTSAND